MAFKKSLAQRLFNAYRITTPSSTTCSLYSSPAITLSEPKPAKTAITHRLRLQPLPPDLQSFPAEESLISRYRIWPERLLPPPEMNPPPEESLTAGDMKKLLKLSQLELVKEKLRKIKNSYISREEFTEICRDGCWSMEEALQFGAALDESGTVVFLGHIVLLRPEEVFKSLQGLMPLHLPNRNDPRLKEFRAMQEVKAAIDKKAESSVRRELWGGLGFFVAQTAVFMRLTFWDFSWDVMEPICFYVTSLNCMAGYAFFLRTAIEPSFEGFFQSRFAAKQRRLMKADSFDLPRFNELRMAFDPQSHTTARAEEL